EIRPEARFTGAWSRAPPAFAEGPGECARVQSLKKDRREDRTTAKVDHPMKGRLGGTAFIPAIADTSLKPQRRNNWAARISCGRPFGGSSGDIAIVFGLSKMAAMDFIE